MEKLYEEIKGKGLKMGNEVKFKNGKMLEWIKDNGFKVREDDKILGGTAYYKRICGHCGDNPMWLGINNPISKKLQNKMHCWDAWLVVCTCLKRVQLNVGWI